MDCSARWERVGRDRKEEQVTRAHLLYQGASVGPTHPDR